MYKYISIKRIYMYGYLKIKCDIKQRDHIKHIIHKIHVPIPLVVLIVFVKELRGLILVSD